MSVYRIGGLRFAWSFHGLCDECKGLRILVKLLKSFRFLAFEGLI